MSVLERHGGYVAGVVFLAVAFGILGRRSAEPAETGDFDGDGRITLKDVLFFDSGALPAEGSLDGYLMDSCMGPLAERALEDPDSASWWSGPNCFLEWLRRGVPGALPPWDPVPDFRVSAQPLPPEPRMLVRLEDTVAPGGADDRVQIALWIENAEAFSAFALIVEADGEILGAPAPEWPPWSLEKWYAHVHWGSNSGYFIPIVRGGDFAVSLSIPGYLLSGGRYVVCHGLESHILGVVPSGAYRVVVEGRLPLGTKAGTYGLRVLPSSEVVFEDGTVVAPLVEGEAAVRVERDVTAGWGEGPVPLRVDPERMEVLGAVEFRLASASGEPLEVVAEGAPGDSVAVLIQMRTEVPLNDVACGFTFPPEKLFCGGHWPDNPEILFRDPEDGLLYPVIERGHLGTYCNDGMYGSARVRFKLAGAIAELKDLGRFEDRILEYFKPLGTWTNLAVVRLRISPSATPGEEIPLLSLPAPGSEFHFQQFWCYGTFHPYYRGGHPYCGDRDERAYWSYPGTAAKGARIRVVEGPPPPPPPDYEIRVILADVSGRPGELVGLPVFASASEVLSRLRLALELNPEVAQVEGMDVLATSRFTGEERTEWVPRAGGRFFEECIDTDGDGVKETCEVAQPMGLMFYATEDRYVLLDLFSGGDNLPYPGTKPRLLGYLQVRIAEDPLLAETALVLATVPQVVQGVPTTASSGGWKWPAESEVRASPLKAYEGGRIRVEGFVPKRFVRGDANGDGKVDISDAVATLGYLFLGSEEPGCLDAADANDSGHLDITDGIFLLGVLFLGAGTVPEPYPECGEDPTPDGLGCRRGCGAG